MTNPLVAPADAALSREQEFLTENDDEAEEYLLTGWFYRAMEEIRNTRIANGLTQEAVAAALGTTQSAIARLENAHRGSFSLERFLRYAWASGAGPLDFQHVPPLVLRQLAVLDPSAARTSGAVHIRHLVDALSVGRLKVDADITWQGSGGRLQKYSMSFESLGNVVGERTNSWAGGVPPSLPAQQKAVATPKDVESGSVSARSGLSEGRQREIVSPSTQRTAA